MIHTISFLYRDARQATAAREHSIADARHAVRNLDARQATAALERIIADARHAVWNLDARQATAAFERTIADARHAIADHNARQATTTIECTIEKIATCNCDTLQRFGNIVSAIIYATYGRTAIILCCSRRTYIT